MRQVRLSLLCMAVLALSVLNLRAADTPKAVLKKGDRVAVVGDSITEQKMYSKYIELYLTACTPELDLHLIQLGWSGERASGFANRMSNDLMPYKPTVVTTCYGMNDGGYAPFNEKTGKDYAGPMIDIVSRLKSAGATVIVGAPGAVDTKFFKGGGEAPKMYNATLAALRDIAKKTAQDHGMPFANVHDAMIDAMTKAKAALGENYDVCGRDGFHPGANGQMIMAYAFLREMGLSGDIAKITVDMKGEASASDGHKVVSSESGKTEIESSRYPFCFFGDEKNSGGTRSIVPFIPFNQELNRFVLVVKNLDADKAAVSWGAETLTFTKAELEAGVNLADKFFNNPFVEAFKKLDGAVSAKQNYETSMIKGVITAMRPIKSFSALQDDKEVEAALESIRAKLMAKYEALHNDVRKMFVPVKHTLVVAPVK